MENFISTSKLQLFVRWFFLTLFSIFCVTINYSQVLVADINQSNGSSNPSNFISNEYGFFFKANDEIYYIQKDKEEPTKLLDKNQFENAISVKILNVFDTDLILSVIFKNSVQLIIYDIEQFNIEQLYDFPLSSINRVLKKDNKLYVQGSTQSIYCINLADNTSEKIYTPEPDANAIYEVSILKDKLIIVLENWSTEEFEIYTLDIYDNNVQKLFNYHSEGIFTMTIYEETLFFTILTENFKTKIWTTDGSPEGTEVFYDPELESDNLNYTFNIFDDKIFYVESIDGNSDLKYLDLNTRERFTYTHNFEGHEKGYFKLIDFDGDNCFFIRQTESLGQELWFSDGTQEGTILLRDIYEGPESAFNYKFYSHAILNHEYYFIADDGKHGRELWKSDGTPEGTDLLKDILPGKFDSDIEFIHLSNNDIYFSAFNYEFGKELWRINSNNEVSVVKDLNTSSSSSSYPNNFFQLNDKLIFNATVNCTGSELFFSDGSSKGTNLLKDFFPGPEGEVTYSMVEYENELYFLRDDEEGLSVLYSTDGTADGTQEIINPIKVLGYEQGSLFGPALVEDRFVFIGSLFNGPERIGIGLVSTKGSPEDTEVLVKIADSGYIDIPFKFYKVSDDFVLFFHEQYTEYQLWRTDGTKEGTYIVKTFPIFSYLDGLGNQVIIGNSFYFIMDNIMYKSDGTSEGTIFAFSNVYPSDCKGNGNYFVCHTWNKLYVKEYNDEELIEIDTEFLPKNFQIRFIDLIDNIVFVEIISNSQNSVYTYFIEESKWEKIENIPVGGSKFLDNSTSLNSILYYSFDDGIHGEELWRSDGTSDGTFLVNDLNPGENSSHISSLYSHDDFIYFSAISTENNAGTELYKYSPYDLDNDGYLPGIDTDDNDPLVNVSSPNDPYDITIECSIVSSLNESLKEIPDIKVYPNPAHSHVYIEMPDSDKFNVQLMDLTGKRVKNIPVASNLSEVYVQDLNAGIYFLIFTSKNSKSIYTSKIVIAK